VSVESNTFQDPPPSPTTTYYVDCDAYHFVGSVDFSPHKISGVEDPHGGTAVVYLTISKCNRALDALTLQPTPYDPDYVEGLCWKNRWKIAAYLHGDWIQVGHRKKSHG
jgi:hypothetical protein